MKINQYAMAIILGRGDDLHINQTLGGHETLHLHRAGWAVIKPLQTFGE
jgi:hypothetical protein